MNNNRLSGYFSGESPRRPKLNPIATTSTLDKLAYGKPSQIFKAALALVFADSIINQKVKKAPIPAYQPDELFGRN